MKVICINALNCTHDSMCGAKKPHDDSSCEPCPFNGVAICVEVKAVPIDDEEGDKINEAAILRMLLL